MRSAKTKQNPEKKKKKANQTEQIKFHVLKQEQFITLFGLLIYKQK